MDEQCNRAVTSAFSDPSVRAKRHRSTCLVPANENVTHIINETPRSLREVVRELVIDVRNFRFRFVVCAFEWRTTGKKLIGEDANTPIIHLILILFMTNDFWGQIVQCTASGCIPAEVTIQTARIPRKRSKLTSYQRAESLSTSRNRLVSSFHSSPRELERTNNRWYPR
jgi:hypothetical protein